MSVYMDTREICEKEHEFLSNVMDEAYFHYENFEEYAKGVIEFTNFLLGKDMAWEKDACKKAEEKD